MPSAIDVPAQVAALADHLAGPVYPRYAANFLRTAYKAAAAVATTDKSRREMERLSFMAANEESGKNWCDVELGRLRISNLFYVSESMMHVAAAASDSLDDSTPLRLEDFPCTSGFLMFEQQLDSIDVFNQVLHIKAIQWCYTLGPEGVGGWTLTYYSDTSARPDLRLGHLGMIHIGFNYLGEAIGPMKPDQSDSLRYRHAPDDDDDPTTAIGKFRYSFQATNLMRIIYSIFRLMEQTVTRLDEHTDTRLAKRVRQGKAKTPPMVTVVTLRRESDHGERDSDGSWLTYRYIRRGHWRKQPYGPGRAEHKTIWISPTMVGSPDLPFHQPKRVTALRH